MVCERDLHCKIVEWFYLQPLIKNKAILINHFNEMPRAVLGTPNGFAYQKTRQKMGHVDGVPDLSIIRKGGEILFLELKYGKNKLSKLQEEYKSNLDKLLIKNHIVYDFEVAIKLIKDFVL